MCVFVRHKIFRIGPKDLCGAVACAEACAVACAVACAGRMPAYMLVIFNFHPVSDTDFEPLSSCDDWLCSQENTDGAHLVPLHVGSHSIFGNQRVVPPVPPVPTNVTNVSQNLSGHVVANSHVSNNHVNLQSHPDPGGHVYHPSPTTAPARSVPMQRHGGSQVKVEVGGQVANTSTTSPVSYVINNGQVNPVLNTNTPKFTIKPLTNMGSTAITTVVTKTQGPATARPKTQLTSTEVNSIRQSVESMYPGLALKPLHRPAPRPSIGSKGGKGGVANLALRATGAAALLGSGMAVSTSSTA